MGDEEVMGTLRVWLEFLFEHDDAVGMDMAVEVENLNINENQENIANRQGHNAVEELDSNDGTANPGVDLEGHRYIEDEDADTSFSSVTSSSTTSSSSDDDDRLRLVPYVESHDSGIDVPDSDQDNTDESVSFKRVEHADASDENSDDDPQPASLREVPINRERSPGSHAVGGAGDSEEDPQPGPSRKRRRDRPRDKDSEEETLHGPPSKITRQSSRGLGEQVAPSSFASEEEPVPGPSRKMEVNSQHKHSYQRCGPYYDDSDCEVVFEERTAGFSQDNQNDETDDD